MSNCVKIDYDSMSGDRSYHLCPKCDRLVPIASVDLDGPPWSLVIYILYSCCVDWAELWGQEW